MAVGNKTLRYATLQCITSPTAQDNSAGKMMTMDESEKRRKKKLSYCWETVRRESMPRIAEMDVEMTT